MCLLSLQNAVLKGYQDQTPRKTEERGLVSWGQCSSTQVPGFELIDHSPYSPDLTPSGYHLFPNTKKKPKKHLAGNQYPSDNDAISSVDDFLTNKMKASSPMKYKHCNTNGRKMGTARDIMLKSKPHLVKFLVSVWIFSVDPRNILGPDLTDSKWVLLQQE